MFSLSLSLNLLALSSTLFTVHIYTYVTSSAEFAPSKSRANTTLRPLTFSSCRPFVRLVKLSREFSDSLRGRRSGRKSHAHGKDILATSMFRVRYSIIPTFVRGREKEIKITHLRIFLAAPSPKSLHSRTLLSKPSFFEYPSEIRRVNSTSAHQRLRKNNNNNSKQATKSAVQLGLRETDERAPT